MSVRVKDMESNIGIQRKNLPHYNETETPPWYVLNV